MLIQLAVLTRADAGQGVELLFVIVVGALWVIGGLLKVAAKKSSQQQAGGQAKDPRRRESWQQRLGRKAEELQRAAEAKGKQAAEQVRRWQEEAGPGRQAQRPGPPRGGKVTVRPGRGGKSVLVYERGSPQDDAERQRQAARLRRARRAAAPAGRHPTVRPPTKRQEVEEGLPGIALDLATPAGTSEHKRGAAPQPVPLRPASLFDYTDPDALKKAILHYEILGKPLALRNSPEQAALF